MSLIFRIKAKNTGQIINLISCIPNIFCTHSSPITLVLSIISALPRFYSNAFSLEMTISNDGEFTTFLYSYSSLLQCLSTLPDGKVNLISNLFKLNWLLLRFLNQIKELFSSQQFPPVEIHCNQVYCLLLFLIC